MITLPYYLYLEAVEMALIVSKGDAPYHTYKKAQTKEKRMK